jgi:hypothetical protein
MPRAVALLVAGAVSGQGLAVQFEPSGTSEQLRFQVEHPIQSPQRTDDSKGSPQRVMVGRLGHPNLRQPVGAVAEECLGFAVTEPQHFADHQAREQLWQREILAAELGGVVRQHLTRERIGEAHRRPWRLAGLHGTAYRPPKTGHKTRPERTLLRVETEPDILLFR